MNNKFTIKFNEKSFAMPWHAKKYPDKNTIVICRIERLEEYGFRVSILNYGGISAFLAYNEISRKRIKCIRSVIKVGDIKPLLVIKREFKDDRVYIDLSNKQLSNAEEEVDKLEKYYRLVNIFHTWLKNIYNAKHFIDGKYISDLTESIQILINKEDDQISQNINTLQSTKSYDSISNIAFDNQYNKECDAHDNKESNDGDEPDYGCIDSEQVNDYHTNNHFDIEQSAATATAAAIEAKKSFPYDTKVWEKIMACTLWKYPISDIYDDIFMKIKMQKITLEEAFPELINLINNISLGNDSNQNLKKEEVVPNVVSEVVPNVVSEVVPNVVSEVVPNVVSEVVPNVVSEDVPNVVSEVVPNVVPNVVSEVVPNVVSEDVPNVVSEDVPNVVSDNDDDSISDEKLAPTVYSKQYVDAYEEDEEDEKDEEDEVEPYIDITSNDLNKLLDLIYNYINYDIIIKLNLKLTSWGYKSLQTIRTILSKIKSIPDLNYKSGFSYNSIILNSPSYDFVIKSTNKALMDKIYPEGCSLEDSELGIHIIDILKEFEHDIDYGIEIERNDIS
jgi:translation initiation factor 2 alpha subunit (eIF-2alpha)